MLLSALSFCLTLSAIGIQKVLANCECGYTMHNNDSYTLYTELIETDFLHLYTLPDSVTAPVSQAVGWAPQAYNVSPTAARGPYGKSAEVGNVVLSPLSGTHDWGGEQGMNGGPPGLQIWVRGAGNLSDYIETDPATMGKMVRGGEIDSLRRDVRYGTFRIGMKMADVAGTCAAFFWYRNNSQEIDLEYLSRQSYSSNGTARINLVIQSPLSAALNYNAAPTTTFALHELPFIPSADYHEYRFDWSPTLISFYADGVFLADFVTQYDPDAPGTLMLNHWSNGDAAWSGGPPAKDAAIAVSYIKAYFNSSDEQRNEEWKTACEAGADVGHGSNGNNGNRSCEIPAFPADGISPLGDIGNLSGKTPFFIYQGPDALINQTVYPAATAAPGAATTITAAETRFMLIMGVLVVLILV